MAGPVVEVAVEKQDEAYESPLTNSVRAAIRPEGESRARWGMPPCMTMAS
ncbi:hypothetical protein [Streptomyces sp. McG3]|nr:hypothetical protein [Streptomyces sp. McG3]